MTLEKQADSDLRTVKNKMARDPFDFLLPTDFLFSPEEVAKFDNDFYLSSTIPRLKTNQFMLNGTIHTRDPNDSTWIQTYSGKKFYPLEPNIMDIDINDIAHSLSMQCRFNGHSSEFYSIAQHSVLVSHVCGRENAMHGLLHDASEYVLGDFASPLKRSGKFQNYKDYEKQLQDLIYIKYGLSTIEPPDVKQADLNMLATEARDLMAPLHPEWAQPCEPLPFKIVPLGPSEAKKLFLDRFNYLNNERF